jgi:DNA-binding transcriptional ArsR family regulator
MSEWPTREITDPTMLRAMAHPLRLKLLNDLVINGPSTATELAERHQESPANCSWHLRQLAKFGLIEEAADLPTKGRNRPWRWVPMGSRWGDATDSPELNLAGDELVTQLMGYEFAERQAWEARKRHEPKDWFDASFAVQSITWMTAEELAAVSEGIRELLMRHIERLNDPSARPEGARPVRFIAWGNPAS